MITVLLLRPFNMKSLNSLSQHQSSLNTHSFPPMFFLPSIKANPPEARVFSHAQRCFFFIIYTSSLTFSFSLSSVYTRDPNLPKLYPDPHAPLKALLSHCAFSIAFIEPVCEALPVSPLLHPCTLGSIYPYSTEFNLFNN